MNIYIRECTQLDIRICMFSIKILTVYLGEKIIGSKLHNWVEVIGTVYVACERATGVTFCIESWLLTY